MAGMSFCPPPADCPLCPRLVSFREENRRKFPDKHNAPVPSFGGLEADLLIVGLAPGLKGANFSGRPFTGDYAGELLYGTLLKFGRAQGVYKAQADDGLALIQTRITNAVRCVPPQNKPEPSEIQNCRSFLKAEMASMKNLKAVLTLGLISHASVIKTLGGKASGFKFAHGAVHDIGGLKVFNSYHCSRYNTQTKRLTTPMFEAVFASINAFTQP
jgi:uracil-DNA glycosylase family 4